MHVLRERGNRDNRDVSVGRGKSFGEVALSFAQHHRVGVES